MPAAYAHITLINLCKESKNLAKIKGLPSEARSAISKYFRFCELGAVSPDYPYLSLGIGRSKAKRWADLMHYERTSDVIRNGAELVARMTGTPKEKGTAWLLGYAAHVITDVSIHPIVELKVGKYKGHEDEHRICEMHQDVHIYSRLNMGKIGLSEHLRSTVGRCTDAKAGKGLDGDIKAIWGGMLDRTHAKEFKKNPPNFDRWHSGFLKAVDKVAEEGDKLIPLARHVAQDLGIVYPDTTDPTYVKNLHTPTGILDYEAIFDKAIANVSQAWGNIAQTIFNNRPELLASMPNWNLDTGRDEAEHLTYWS